MIIFITGGARSGKSSFAENFYKGEKDVVYIATAKIEDEEMEERVKNHKNSRPETWRTFEGYTNLTKSIGEEKNYLLDCMTVMTSNILFEETKDMERIDEETQSKVENRIYIELKNLIEEIRKIDGNLILVTNEVGSSIVPEYHISRVFRDIQGRVNQKVAKLADEAYLVVSGMPVKLK